jgi:hypothetical protein
MVATILFPETRLTISCPEGGTINPAANMGTTEIVTSDRTVKTAISCRSSLGDTRANEPILNMPCLSSAANNIKRFGHTSPVSLGDHFLAVSRVLGENPVRVTYAEYRELKHTWSTRNGDIAFKISDYLDAAPEDVQRSLAWYLLCRAHGRKCPNGEERPYLAYVRSKELWSNKRETFLSRTKNLSFAPRGDVRDLKSVFEYVNSYYFSGRLKDPDLAWVDESPLVRFGFYFEPLNLLATNKILDTERIPRYVLEFVMYHELLHYVDPGNGRTRRRVHHTKEFREQEKAFSHYEESEHWLRRIVSQIRIERRNGLVPQA